MVCACLRPAKPFLLAALALLTLPVAAQDRLASIIIDDIGDSYERIEQLIDADMALTLAILPNTRYAKQIARQAHARGKEIMLHLPLQPVRHQRLTPGTLHMHMTEQAFRRQLQQHLAAIPHVRGVNNHMGSLMTRHPGTMNWLMQTLARHDDLYFIDSRTTEKSIATQIAEEYRVPHLQRDVFLDPQYDHQTLEQQFQRFIDTARTRGSAIAIAHPAPLSIQYILDNVPRLRQHGIRLVPVSQLIQQRQAQRQLSEADRHVTCTGTACSGL